MAERAARARSAHSMAMAMLTPCILAFTAPLQDASSIASATFSTAYSLYLGIGGSFRVCALASLLDPGERGHDRPLRHLVGQVLLHDPLCGLHLLQFLCDLLHQILCGHLLTLQLLLLFPQNSYRHIDRTFAARRTAELKHQHVGKSLYLTLQALDLFFKYIG